MPEKGNRDLTLLILTATALGVLDSLIPKPLPFMKLGLANVVTVIAVIRFGFLKALELNVIRAFAVALVTGLLATPSFLLSISGAVASAMIMGLLLRLAVDKLSISGLSVAGAVVSLWVQLLVAGLVLRGLPLRSIVLLVTLWGVISGAVVGLMAQKAMDRKLISRVLRKA